MFPIASTLGMSNSAYSLMQGTQRARNLAFSGNANTNNLAAVHNAETMNMLVTRLRERVLPLCGYGGMESLRQCCSVS